MKKNKSSAQRNNKKEQSLQEIHRYSDLLIKAALAEDVGAFDVTTKAVVASKEKGTAEFIAKEDMVMAGLFIPEKVFKYLDKKSEFSTPYKDGDAVMGGQVIATVSGRLDSLLIGERVALNFLQRMSGIATLTNKFVQKTWSSNTKILDTRKTTPCLRILEKYAVKAGGGYNHRFGLYDGVLIKDNHIAAAGSITKAVKRVTKAYGDSMVVEVEVTNFKETREAIDAGADIIMLDNMDPGKMKKALAIIKGRALVEASGGVTLDNIEEFAKTGVDFISIGALTHSAKAVDISMEISICKGKRQRKSR